MGTIITIITVAVILYIAWWCLCAVAGLALGALKTFAPFLLCGIVLAFIVFIAGYHANDTLWGAFLVGSIGSFIIAAIKWVL